MPEVQGAAGAAGRGPVPPAPPSAWSMEALQEIMAKKKKEKKIEKGGKRSSPPAPVPLTEEPELGVLELGEGVHAPRQRRRSVNSGQFGMSERDATSSTTRRKEASPQQRACSGRTSSSWRPLAVARPSQVCAGNAYLHGRARNDAQAHRLPRLARHPTPTQPPDLPRRASCPASLHFSSVLTMLRAESLRRSA